MSPLEWFPHAAIFEFQRCFIQSTSSSDYPARCLECWSEPSESFTWFQNVTLEMFLHGHTKWDLRYSMTIIDFSTKKFTDSIACEGTLSLCRSHFLGNILTWWTYCLRCCKTSVWQSDQVGKTRDALIFVFKETDQYFFFFTFLGMEWTWRFPLHNLHLLYCKSKLPSLVITVISHSAFSIADGAVAH
jgi:hypothetical protein